MRITGFAHKFKLRIIAQEGKPGNAIAANKLAVRVLSRCRSIVTRVIACACVFRRIVERHWSASLTFNACLMVPVLADLALDHNNVGIVIVCLIAPAVQPIKIMIVGVAFVPRSPVGVFGDLTGARTGAVAAEAALVE